MLLPSASGCAIRGWLRTVGGLFTEFPGALNMGRKRKRPTRGVGRFALINFYAIDQVTDALTMAVSVPSLASTETFSFLDPAVNRPAELILAPPEGTSQVMAWAVLKV